MQLLKISQLCFFNNLLVCQLSFLNDFPGKLDEALDQLIEAMNPHSGMLYATQGAN